MIVDVDGLPRTVYRKPCMEYLSKTMRLDDEVVAWLDKLKKIHGSYNKGLRLVAFAGGGRDAMPSGINEVVVRHGTPRGLCEKGDDTEVKELTYEREE